MDEKSQIQALDRSQPVLPMMPGIPERRSHDYVRAGTTTLFAALDDATGKVIGSLHRRHRAAGFKKFLAKLDKEVPAGLEVHLERWFAELTQKKLKGGVHRSVQARERDNPGLARRLERPAQALHLDKDRRRDPPTKSPPTATESLTQVTKSS
ncbi:hypothetical protein GCM10010493_83440 [Streptomyces lavendulae subsp. grasserius]